MYGPSVQSWTFMPLKISVDARSNVLPCLCVEKEVWHCKPDAWKVSAKIIASGSSSLLICILKSPMGIFFLSSTRIFFVQFVNSYINTAFVTGLITEYGGRYSVTILVVASGTVKLHLANWKVCNSPSESLDTFASVLCRSASPPPALPE